ncbi:MAG: tyrosine-protein phosphatase [Frankia sp.]
MTSRWFDLSGCDNTRDLGGLPTVDGRVTRRGVLLRSDTLQELTGPDVERLRDDFGLRTVIDLRAPAEAAREGRGPLGAPDPEPTGPRAPVEYHNLSFLKTEYVMPDDPRFPLIVADLDAQDRVEHYLDYLRRAGDTVAAALTVIARPGATPAVFHCAAGKDRTGVLAALLSDLVGVERDAIVEDFTLTNERIDRIDARLARLPSYRRERRKLTADQMSCRPEVMRGFLDGVDKSWGGTAPFALAHGVDQTDLARLRTLLVG